ncbi:MAG: hypothetical protein MRJ68_19150 [Nitrospira sp.]|nr:hypothetical protein [Nitrospira sp.]
MSRPRKFQPVDLPGDDIEQMTEEQLHAEIRRLGEEPRRACQVFDDSPITFNEETGESTITPWTEDDWEEARKKAHQTSLHCWRMQIYSLRLNQKLIAMPDKDLWKIYEDWSTATQPWRMGRDFTPSAKRQTPRERLIMECHDAINAQPDHALNPRRKNAKK